MQNGENGGGVKADRVEGVKNLKPELSRSPGSRFGRRLYRMAKIRMMHYCSAADALEVALSFYIDDRRPLLPKPEIGPLCARPRWKAPNWPCMRK